MKRPLEVKLFDEEYEIPVKICLIPDALFHFGYSVFKSNIRTRIHPVPSHIAQKTEFTIFTEHFLKTKFHILIMNLFSLSTASTGSYKINIV